MTGARNGRGPAGRAASGNVVVELALVLPLFLLIVAGIIDLGTLYWEKQILTNATAEGARLAARAATGGVADQTSSQILQIVQRLPEPLPSARCRRPRHRPDPGRQLQLSMEHRPHPGAVVRGSRPYSGATVTAAQYPEPLRRRPLRDDKPAGPDHHGGGMDHAAGAVRRLPGYTFRKFRIA